MVISINSLHNGLLSWHQAIIDIIDELLALKHVYHCMNQNKIIVKYRPSMLKMYLICNGIEIEPC